MVLQFIKSGFNKVKSVVSKTKAQLSSKIFNLFKSGINDDTLEELEGLLYEADLGVKTAVDLTDMVRKLKDKNGSISTDALIIEIKKEIISILSEHSSDLKEIPKSEGPTTMFIVGVNGNGKTTSVAKLAYLFKQNNKKVLVAAADTFRAAAMDQLQTWTDRIGVDIVRGLPKSDPAAVVFDAMSAGKSRDADVILIDTAGRLHTKTDLMKELEKMRRSCNKVLPGSPHETLLVLDATTGQNAIDQAKVFHSFTPITGLILTKLDGSAKGGIVVSIVRQLKIPIKFIGVGESMEDLEPFDAEEFVSGLFD